MQETKESKPKKSRPKDLKPVNEKIFALPRPSFTNPRKLPAIIKKKEYLKKKLNQKNSILAIGDNANAIEGGEKKRNN